MQPVSRWERGRTVPTPLMRERLCELYGLTAVDLGLVPPPTVPSSSESAQLLTPTRADAPDHQPERPSKQPTVAPSDRVLGVLAYALGWVSGLRDRVFMEQAVSTPTRNPFVGRLRPPQHPSLVVCRNCVTERRRGPGQVTCDGADAPCGRGRTCHLGPVRPLRGPRGPCGATTPARRGPAFGLVSATTGRSIGPYGGMTEISAPCPPVPARRPSTGPYNGTFQDLARRSQPRKVHSRTTDKVRCIST